MVFDAHRKTGQHKTKLEQYDEERDHILEQMMWIDKAAKKVHQKFSDGGANDGTYYESNLNEDTNDSTDKNADPLRRSINELHEELYALKIRIQLNAREYIDNRFGDQPFEVALNIDGPNVINKSQRQFVIALSDDTPHAAATFVQQIDKKMWDEIEFEKFEDEPSAAGIIQVTTKLHPNTMPLLEFVENSRGCHEIGSVSMRQLQTLELHVLVLRIHTKENVDIDQDSDVCIGKVVSGFNDLKQLQLVPLHMNGNAETDSAAGGRA